MEAMQKKKHKILVVDDNSENIRIIGSILRENSFLVGFATGGQQALDILMKKEDDYDLVLLDVNMPGTNGLEVCATVRANPHLQNLPVIFLTANAEPEQIIEGFAAGGQDYVTKPFHAGELLSRIATHIELKENREQLLKMNSILEEKVMERTRELSEANQKLKNAYQELESLDAAKSEFLQIISHEINTPLNGIMGFGEILKSELISTEYFDYIEYLMQSAYRLHQFTKDSLEITQIRTTPEKYKKEKIDINAILNELPISQSKMLSQKNIRTNYQPGSESHLIEGNEELIRICMNHVFRNAIHYAPEGSEIMIETKSDSLKTTIIVTDDGPGFTQTALQTLFKPFSPGEMHIDQNKGLGLALVKTIADFHHARIRISNVQDHGARVELIFDNTNPLPD